MLGFKYYNIWLYKREDEYVHVEEKEKLLLNNEEDDLFYALKGLNLSMQ